MVKVCSADGTGKRLFSPHVTKSVNYEKILVLEMKENSLKERKITPGYPMVRLYQV